MSFGRSRFSICLSSPLRDILFSITPRLRNFVKKHTKKELLAVDESEDHIFLRGISRKAKIYNGADFLRVRSRKAKFS